MKFVTVLLILLLSVGALSLPGAAADENYRDPHRAGVAALRAGAIPSAISLLTKAIEQDPDNYRYYNDRGVAYKRAGNLEAALSDYARALEIKPDYENALNNRGVGYLVQGLYDKAIADFTKAMKSETLKAKASNNLGVAYAAKGDHSEAIKHFNQAISFGATDYRTFLFLAESLRRTGAAEKALRIYHLARGLSKDPGVRKQIEDKISRVKQNSGTAQPVSERTSPSKEGRSERGSLARRASRNETTVQNPEVRTIVRALPPKENKRKPAVERVERQVTVRRDRPARPESQSGPVHRESQQVGVSRPHHAEGRKRGEPVRRPESEIKSVQDLDNRIRATATKKLSPVAAQIYAQGREFLQKSDTAKALVRFEDTRQLERRKRSYYGVAWSDLEIGRAYSALGEHHNATPYFEESLRFFKRLGAQNESILAMTELAKNQNATRGKSESAGSFNKAVEMAVSAGHYTLARAMGDESAGMDKQAKKPEKAVAARDEKTKQVLQKMRGSARAPTQKLTGGRVKVEAENKTNAQTKRPDSKRLKLEKVGTGTDWYVKLGDRTKSTDKPLITKARVGSADKKTNKSKMEPQPKRVVFWAKDAKPSADRHSAKKRRGSRESKERRLIEKDRDELRKLKEQNDERRMVIVLERLSERYMKLIEPANALHCLDASLGLRDDLRFMKGQSEALERRGRVREKLGLKAEGLEDLSRALALGASRPKT